MPRPLPAVPRRDIPRLSAAAERYQAIRVAHVALTTYRNDWSMLRAFIRGVGDVQVHLLDQDVVEAWFASEAQRTAPRSYNKTLSRIRQYLNYCARRGWCSGDPLGEVRTRRVVEQAERMRLSPAQMLALLDGAPNPRDRGFLACAMHTALRSGDLTRLTLASIDLDAGFITLVVQKTGRADRLPITSGLDAELRAWLTAYTAALAEQGLSVASSDYLFPGLRPPRPIGGAQPRMDRTMMLLRPQVRIARPEKIVQAGLVRLGQTATRGEGCHTIRRSVARALWEHAAASGESQAIRVVQAQLGHREQSTTESYIGLDEDRRRRDALLRGRSFLSAPADNVTPIRKEAAR